MNTTLSDPCSDTLEQTILESLYGPTAASTNIIPTDVVENIYRILGWDANGREKKALIYIMSNELAKPPFEGIKRKILYNDWFKKVATDVTTYDRCLYELPSEPTSLVACMIGRLIKNPVEVELNYTHEECHLIKNEELLDEMFVGVRTKAIDLSLALTLMHCSLSVAKLYTKQHHVLNSTSVLAQRVGVLHQQQPCLPAIQLIDVTVVNDNYPKAIRYMRDTVRVYGVASNHPNHLPDPQVIRYETLQMDTNTYISGQIKISSACSDRSLASVKEVVICWPSALIVVAKHSKGVDVLRESECVSIDSKWSMTPISVLYAVEWGMNLMVRQIFESVRLISLLCSTYKSDDVGKYVSAKWVFPILHPVTVLAIMVKNFECVKEELKILGFKADEIALEIEHERLQWCVKKCACHNQLCDSCMHDVIFGIHMILAMTKEMKETYNSEPHNSKINLEDLAKGHIPAMILYACAPTILTEYILTEWVIGEQDINDMVSLLKCCIYNGVCNNEKRWKGKDELICMFKITRECLSSYMIDDSLHGLNEDKKLLWAFQQTPVAMERLPIIEKDMYIDARKTILNDKSIAVARSDGGNTRTIVCKSIDRVYSGNNAIKLIKHVVPAKLVNFSVEDALSIYDKTVFIAEDDHNVLCRIGGEILHLGDGRIIDYIDIHTAIYNCLKAEIAVSIGVQKSYIKPYTEYILEGKSMYAEVRTHAIVSLLLEAAMMANRIGHTGNRMEQLLQININDVGDTSRTIWVVNVPKQITVPAEFVVFLNQTGYLKTTREGLVIALSICRFTKQHTYCLMNKTPIVSNTNTEKTKVVKLTRTWISSACEVNVDVDAELAIKAVTYGLNEYKYPFNARNTDTVISCLENIERRESCQIILACKDDKTVVLQMKQIKSNTYGQNVGASAQPLGFGLSSTTNISSTVQPIMREQKINKVSQIALTLENWIPGLKIDTTRTSAIVSALILREYSQGSNFEWKRTNNQGCWLRMFCDVKNSERGLEADIPLKILANVGISITKEGGLSKLMIKLSSSCVISMMELTLVNMNGTESCKIRIEDIAEKSKEYFIRKLESKSSIIEKFPPGIHRVDTSGVGKMMLSRSNKVIYLC